MLDSNQLSLVCYICQLFFCFPSPSRLSRSSRSTGSPSASWFLKLGLHNVRLQVFWPDVILQKFLHCTKHIKPSPQYQNNNTKIYQAYTVNTKSWNLHAVSKHILKPEGNLEVHAQPLTIRQSRMLAVTFLVVNDGVYYTHSLHFNSHFPGGPGLADTRISPFSILWVLRMMAVVVKTGDIGCAKLQSNRHHQHTNIQLFTDQMPFLSPNQPCQSTGYFTLKTKNTITRATVAWAVLNIGAVVSVSTSKVIEDSVGDNCLSVCLVLNGTVSTYRLYRAIGIWNT